MSCTLCDLSFGAFSQRRARQKQVQALEGFRCTLYWSHHDVHGALGQTALATLQLRPTGQQPGEGTWRQSRIPRSYHPEVVTCQGLLHSA